MVWVGFDMLHGHSPYWKLNGLWTCQADFCSKQGDRQRHGISKAPKDSLGQMVYFVVWVPPYGL